MAFEISSDQTSGYLLVVIHGELTLNTLKELAQEVARRSAEWGCKNVINDLRNATPTRVIDIYDMPQAAKEAGIMQSQRRALVVGDKSKDFYFLETVFLNQGHQVRMFASLEDAKKWLLVE